MTESLEKLLAFYEKRIEEKSIAASNGEFPYGDEQELLRKEKGLAAERGSSAPERVDERSMHLLNMLYSSLKSQDTFVLSNLLTKVRDPILDASLLWLAQHKGLQHTTVREFTAAIDSQIEKRRFPQYLRPLVLLDLTQQSPEIVERLTENSTYFPNRLFPRERITLKSMELEIAKTIPSLFSEELLEIVPKISGYLCDSGTHFKPHKNRRYVIPLNIACKWTQLGYDSWQDLQMYEARETKKQVFETLADVLQLITEEVGATGRKIGGISSAFRFKTSRSEYRILMGSIEDYATNQILHVWRKAGIIPETHLSRQVRVMAREEGDQLIVKSFFCNSFFGRDEYYKDTDRHLPVCVRRLHKYLLISESVIRQNDTK
jgi:hypothetical protein